VGRRLQEWELPEGATSGWRGATSRAKAAMRAFARFLRRERLGAVGLVIVLLVIVAAVAGPGIAPYGKDEVISIPNPNYDPDSFEGDALSETTVAILAPPSWGHPFGTDDLGRDLLTRMLYGARTALIVGVGAALLAAVAGTTIAIVSGYLGGLVDLLIQRVVDAVIAIPGLIILLLLVQAGERSLTLTVLALATLGTFGTSRVIRSAVLGIRSSVFVEAARTLGASPPRIMVRHVVPNLVGPIIVVFSISIGVNILAEAGLAFLNLSAPGPSWGAIVSQGRAFIETKPMMSLVGGGAITLTVLAFNVLGDALRDTLDPRQRGAL